MEIKVHNSNLDGNQSTSKVKANTNPWIPFKLSNLTHIQQPSTHHSSGHQEVPPFMLPKKGADQGIEMKGT